MGAGTRGSIALPESFRWPVADAELEGGRAVRDRFGVRERLAPACRGDIAMPRHANTTATGQDRSSLYAEITDRIVAELEAGRFPWVQPWGSAGAASPLDLPNNATTGRRYLGINVLILWGAVIEGGFATQSWLTFRQAKALGASVRKGERGTTVVYASRFIPGEDAYRPVPADDRRRGIPFLKRFTVFNAEQCEGLPTGLGVSVAPPALELILPQAERLIEATGVDFRIGGARAYYDPVHDYMRVPPPQAYFDAVNWHRTAFHELAHASGHVFRLNRDLTGSFGSKKYAQEELVPRFLLPMSAQRWVSCPPYATPTTLDRGWN